MRVKTRKAAEIRAFDGARRLPIMAKNREVATMFQDPVALHDFGHVAKIMLTERGKHADMTLAAERGTSARVRAIVKALPLMATPASPGAGSELAGSDYADVADALIASMRHGNAFDTILVDARRVPLRTRIVAVVTGAEGSSPAEGGIKVISQLALADGQLGLRKATCTIVVSDPLARLAGEAGIELLNTEIKGGVGVETDRVFLAAITSGVVPIPSSGTDASAVRADIQAGLEALGLGAQSRPHIVVSAGTALALALMENTDGSAAFPDMGVSGGSISGVPVHASDGTPAGAMVLLDASSIAADPGTIVLNPATHATVDMGAGPVSLWQENLLGLRAERFFGAEPGRPGAVAVIDGVAYGPSETSP